MCAGVGNGKRERKLQMNACQATFCALPCIWFAHCSPCNVLLLLLLSESLKRMCYWCCWLLLLLLLLSPPPPLPLLLWLLQPFLSILFSYGNSFALLLWLLFCVSFLPIFLPFSSCRLRICCFFSFFCSSVVRTHHTQSVQLSKHLVLIGIYTQLHTLFIAFEFDFFSVNVVLWYGFLLLFSIHTHTQVQRVWCAHRVCYFTFIPIYSHRLKNQLGNSELVCTPNQIIQPSKCLDGKIEMDKQIFIRGRERARCACSIKRFIYG